MFKIHLQENIHERKKLILLTSKTTNNRTILEPEEDMDASRVWGLSALWYSIYSMPHAYYVGYMHAATYKTHDTASTVCSMHTYYAAYMHAATYKTHVATYIDNRSVVYICVDYLTNMFVSIIALNDSMIDEWWFVGILKGVVLYSSKYYPEFAWIDWRRTWETAGIDSVLGCNSNGTSPEYKPWNRKAISKVTTGWIVTTLLSAKRHNVKIDYKGKLLSNGHWYYASHL
jgi:hypothetical protein